MNAEEKAKDIVESMGDVGQVMPSLWAIKIAKAIAAAVEAEREACAQFLAKHACIYLTARDLELFPSEQWARFDAIAHMLEEMGKAIRARAS